MAKATTVIHKMEKDPKELHEQQVKEIESLLVEHKDSIEDVFTLIHQLRDREVLNLAHGALGQSEHVLHRIVTAMDSKETTQSIKNALLIFELLGTVNMNELEPIVLKLNHGIKLASEYDHSDQPVGIGGLIRSLNDKEVIEGMNVLMKFVKGFGVDEAQEEKIEPQLKRLEHPEKEMGTQKRGSTSNTKPARVYAPRLFGFLTGALVLLVPLLIKKK